MDVSKSGEMSLYCCLWKREFEQANRLLDDPSFDVNVPVSYPPLVHCAVYTKDSKDERGNYIGDEHVQIMRRILQHPTSKRRAVASRKVCSWAMFWVCNYAQSVTAARLLLNEDNLNLNYHFPGVLPTIHEMMEELKSSTIEMTIQILGAILKYRHLGDSVYDLDRYGLSILDRFICNKYIHCYDLDSTENAKQILELLLSVKGLSKVSGKTLALAGTCCLASGI